MINTTLTGTQSSSSTSGSSGTQKPKSKNKTADNKPTSKNTTTTKPTSKSTPSAPVTEDKSYTSKGGYTVNQTVTTNPNGQTIQNRSYTDNNGNQVRTTIITNPDGSTETHKTVKGSDGSTTSTTKNKDASGASKAKSITKESDGSKTVTKTERNIDNEIVNQNKTKYNSNGQKTSETSYSAAANTTEKSEWSYDDRGQVKESKTDTYRINEEGTEILSKTATTTYESGKANKTVEKDNKDNVLSTTDYKYDDKGDLSSTYTKNSDGTNKEVLYKDGAKLAGQTTDKNGKVLEFETYNRQNGNVATKEIYNYNENEQASGTEKYIYDSDGTVTSKEKYNKNQELETISSYTTDANGKQTENIYTPTGDLKGSIETSYDRYGQIESEVKKNSNGKVTSTTTYEYYDSGILKESTKTSGKGNVLSETSYSETGVTTQKNSYSKNSNGEYCLTQSDYDANGNKITETKYNSQNEVSQTTTYQNDEKGNPIQAEIYNGNGEKSGDISYEYDSNRNVTNIKTQYTNGKSKEYSYTYDDKNRVLTESFTNSKGETKTTSNVYDKNGNLIQQTETGYDNTTTVMNYTRDKLGRITEKSITDNEGNTTKEIYEYNLNDNRIKNQITINPDGTYTKQEFGYYKSGVKKFEISSLSSDKNKYTVTIYDKNGNLIDEPIIATSVSEIGETLNKLNPAKSKENTSNTDSKGTPKILYTGAQYDKETGTYTLTVETYKDGKVQDDGNGGTRYPNGSFWGIVENTYPEVSEAQKSIVYDIISKMNDGKTALYTGDVLKMPILVYDDNGNITGYKTETDGKVYSVPNSSGNWNTATQTDNNVSDSPEQLYTVRVNSSRSVTYILQNGTEVDCVGGTYYTNGKPCFFDEETGKISYSEFIESSSSSGTFILPDGTEIYMYQGHYSIDGKPCRFNSSTGEYSFIKDDTNTTTNEIQRESFDTVLKNLTDDYTRNNGLWYTPEQILEVIESSGKSINELIAESHGNAESLKALDNALGNYTNAYEFIDKDNISDDLINIISTVYDGKSGIIKELYDDAYQQILSSVTPKYQSQFKDYVNGLSLSEMNENVDYFNKFVTEGLNNGYIISDAEGWIAQEKRKGN